jgi:hypothetical protein
MEIFIPGNTPSLKNSKIATRKGIFPSKTVAKYLRSLGIQYFSSSKKIVKEYVDKNRPNLFRESFKDWKKPNNQVIIGFHFVRATKHKFDFGNACQIIQDLMVAHDFIEDDNMNYLIPVPVLKDDNWFTYDKENPGCYIYIIDIKKIKKTLCY